MIKGIGGKPYIDLDPHLDIETFKNLHPEICKGFALARDYAKEGTWMEPGFEWNDCSYILNWKPIYKAWNEYQALPITILLRSKAIKYCLQTSAITNSVTFLLAI